MFEFLKALIDFFEKQKISYMLSGSVAMSLYTQPRFTRDYDFVVNLKAEHINEVLKNFREGYYINEESVKDAISGKGMFNIIDHKSGYKADFVILKDEPFRQTEFLRQRKMKFLDMNISIVSPEDLLLSKLIWIQEIQSGVQMEDIKMISNVENLDWNYIHDWIKELNLKTFNLLPG
ncbi:MAG TPA: hypothetical protein VKB95_05170 [Chitinophagaceae bacterium]|nr:hypothetical protein [Chitinophagaceae bacterium]